MMARKLLTAAAAVILAPALCKGEPAAPGPSAAPPGSGPGSLVEEGGQQRLLKTEGVCSPLKVERLPGRRQGDSGSAALASGRRQALVENIWRPLLESLRIGVGSPLVERAGEDRYTLKVPVTAQIPGRVIDRVGMWADAQADLATYSWDRFEGKAYGALRAYDGSPGGDDTVEIHGRSPETEALLSGAYVVFRVQAGDRVVVSRPYRGEGGYDQLTVETRFVASLGGLSEEELGRLERVEVVACLELPPAARLKG